MSKLSNKDLDRLFREGAEQYDPLDVKPEAWQQMEALLERQRRRRILLWWLLGMAGVILVVSASLFFLGSTGNGNGGREDSPRRKDHPQASENYEAPAADDQDRAAPSPSDTVPPDYQAANDQILQCEGPASSAAGSSPIIPVAGPQGKDSSGLAREMVAPAVTMPEDDYSKDETDPKGHTKHPALPQESQSRITAPLPTLPAAIYWQMPARALPAAAPVVAFPLPPLAADSLPGAALVASINGAPEASAAAGSTPGPLDLRLGLTVELRYARHFSVSSGVLLSKKKYSAGEDAYTPPKGFWTNKIAPVSTDAECTVLEVPLNVGYYLRHHSASTFFFEAGLSNFIMLEEHYWYSYDDPTPGLIKYWGAENENRHLLSILNIAAGYQWQPRQWLGLQISPYAQIPIAGVGHGKVALYSFGINLRMNFTALAW